MQGGMGVVRMPDGSLASATGAAGNDVFRGDRLPKDLIGDYFYGEVVARIVRRLHPMKTEGLTQLQNVYPLSEFIRSTDPLFRPVDLTTAPDGTMYITDMYRGIIQESQWSGPGTYLRQRIDQYGLDKVVRHGRIWRLTYEGMPRRTDAPRMLQETPAQLVSHLNDANGWWRDTAQQLLVLKQDKSIVPALKQLARSGGQLARIHAMWTLEGLQSVDATFIRELMKDSDPQIRIQAIRVSETIYKSGDKSLGADYKAMTRDRDTDVVMQAVMTLNTLKVADAPATIKATFESNQSKGVQLVANTILNPPANAGRGGLESIGATALTPEERTTLDKGQEIYGQVCFACHGEDGRGEQLPGAPSGTTRAPALASSPRVVHRGDGADGAESRRLDRGDRVLRSQLVRQSRVDRFASRRRPRSCRRGQPQQVVDDRGAGSVAAQACTGGGLEADGESQSGDRVAGPRDQTLDVRARAAAGHVVPDRAAAADIADRDSVHVDGAGRRYDADSSGRADADGHSRRSRCAGCCNAGASTARVPA